MVILLCLIFLDTHAFVPIILQIIRYWNHLKKIVINSFETRFLYVFPNFLIQFTFENKTPFLFIFVLNFFKISFHQNAIETFAAFSKISQRTHMKRYVWPINY